jgi:hypothetical protein
MIWHLLTSRITMFLLGATATSVVFEAVRPTIGRAARSTAKEVVRAGMLAGRELRRVRDGIGQDLEDIVAEVRADLEGEAASPARADTARSDGARTRRSRKA